MNRFSTRHLLPVLIPLFLTACTAQKFHDPFRGMSLSELGTKLSQESQEAYKNSPYAPLSQDYFSRFTRDPHAHPQPSETVLDDSWHIAIADGSSPLAERMAGYLVDFLNRRMDVSLEIQKLSPNSPEFSAPRVIRLCETGGGTESVDESFTIEITDRNVRITGRDPAGLRDGIVKFVDIIGFRQAPFLAQGSQVYTPRLSVRLGTIPWMGSTRDLVFMGYNAAFVSGGNLHELSQSKIIPELIPRQTSSPANIAQSAVEARAHGLKTYCFINTRQKYDKDDPVFQAHPDMRGALTWKADGQYVLCTEHPLVRQYLKESVQGIFKADPNLDGLVLIIGGEGFYHCFMRPYGVKKGHTNCPRCEALGAETVVANLCNLLADAVREINPKAEVIAWPYSAEHVWSADKAQEGLIEKLKPGTAIFTEIEKDEYDPKPDGFKKHLWDYSIDLIGPGERAKKQVAACKKAGISIYMKSEPELSFEAPRLPHIPCMDLWLDRADALASCGADGAWVFPAFRPCYGTSAAEINKYVWWEPAPDHDAVLQSLAARMAGYEAASYVRDAWHYVSEAINFSPELPPYYTGPYYLGPAHPMCADPDAELPPVFYGRYLFHAEITDSEGLKTQPTFMKTPTGNIPVFTKYYQRMSQLLGQAAERMDYAEHFVPRRQRLTFDAEASAIRWFYHTARTEANFYESCQLRDRLLELAKKPYLSATEKVEAGEKYARWMEILLDERENTREALPVVQNDMRLDFYYGSDHTFPHAEDMIRAKLKIIDSEISDFLPQIAEQCGIQPER